MDIKACYKEFGGDYEDVYLRLMSDERIERFVKKFVELDDCAAMLTALEAGDYKTAFLKAHDLKGTSSGLGMTKLYKSSSRLCEALRGGEPSEDVHSLSEQVRIDCGAIISAVEKYSS